MRIANSLLDLAGKLIVVLLPDSAERYLMTFDL
jgi:cysteine synthase